MLEPVAQVILRSTAPQSRTGALLCLEDRVIETVVHRPHLFLSNCAYVILVARRYSRKGGEIGSSIILDDRAQAIRSKHLDGISPLIEVPDHFEPTGGVETDDQAAIIL